jgi:hypothetical protein
MKIVIALACAVLAHANLTTPGTLAWTGTPTTLDHPLGTTILATGTGMLVFGGCYGSPGFCGTSFWVERPFTVTVEGTFTLTASETTDMSGTPCTIFANCGAASIIGSYSDSVSAGSSPLTLADSGTATSQNPNLPATLSFSRSQSETFALTVGDYMLSDMYRVSVRGDGDVSYNFSLTDELVPDPPSDVPEPRLFGLMGGVLLLLWNRHRRAARQNLIR